jgi:hypothetical protein
MTESEDGQDWRAQICCVDGEWRSCEGGESGGVYKFSSAHDAAKMLRMYYSGYFRMDRMDKTATRVRVFNVKTNQTESAWQHA